LLLLTQAGFKPYQAIKEASLYTQGELGKEVRQLVIEMDATGDELKSLQSFADRIDIIELKNVVTALSQAMTTDSAKAREIYAHQANYMREMRVANIKKLIKEVPARVKSFNMILFLITLIITLAPLFLMFSSMKMPI
jgi:pilus assembly protein TadC